MINIKYKNIKYNNIKYNNIKYNNIKYNNINYQPRLNLITMSDVRETLVNTIKEWIDADNEIKQLQQLLKAQRAIKKSTTDTLVEIMKENEIDCVDLQDKKIIHSSTKTKQAISKKYLLETLPLYFKDDAEKVDELTAFILANRQEKIKDVIRTKNK
jgi:hypothetical protein